jgi:hypothetical protein
VGKREGRREKEWGGGKKERERRVSEEWKRTSEYKKMERGKKE